MRRLFGIVRAIFASFGIKLDQGLLLKIVNPILRRYGLALMDTPFVEEQFAMIYGYHCALTERIKPQEKIAWNADEKTLTVITVN